MVNICGRIDQMISSFDRRPAPISEWLDRQVGVRCKSDLMTGRHLRIVILKPTLFENEGSPFNNDRVVMVYTWDDIWQKSKLKKHYTWVSHVQSI